MLTLHDRVSLRSDALVQEIGGDVVIISPQQAEFLVLNASGAYLLQKVQSDVPLRQLAVDLAARYDLPAAQAEVDVLKWAQELIDARALTLTSSLP